MANSIDIQRLTFTYRGQADGPALDDFSLALSEGEFLVILGPSGAGKSTLLHLLDELGIVQLAGFSRAGEVVHHRDQDGCDNQPQDQVLCHVVQLVTLCTAPERQLAALSTLLITDSKLLQPSSIGTWTL